MAKTEAQIRATRKYEAKAYDRINVRLPKGTKERIEKSGESYNAFMQRAILDRLDSMNL